MRATFMILLAVQPFLTGCNLTKLIEYNAVNEPVTVLSNRLLAHRADKMAKNAWLDHLVTLVDNAPPEAYAIGFVNGYSDYLLKGGNCSPPAIPPASFRRKRNMDAEGHLEIRAYYAGFAAGSAAARASGDRRYFLVPISTPLPPEDNPNYDAGREIEKTFPTETLPVPEKIPEKGEKLPVPVPKEMSNLPVEPESIESPLLPVPVQDAPALIVPSAYRPLRSAKSESLPDRKPIEERRDQQTPLPREFTVPILNGAGAR